MSDLIDRQKAIDAIYKEWDGSSYDGDGYYIASECERVLEELPSVQPSADLIHLQKEQAYMQGYEDGQKPRKGKWTFFLGTGYGNPYGHFECNLCGDGYGYKTNFCLTCGADMRGKQNDS